jgi:hypothetical protein
MDRYPVRLIAVLSLAVLGSGCAGLTASQKAAITEFSRATNAVGQMTQAELTEMRERMIQTNQRRLVLRGKDSGLTPAGPLDGNLTVSNVSVVVAAATALQGYGEMLEALATDTQTAELQGAADKFTTSLGRVPNVKLSQGESDAIKGAVVFAGQLFIEAKKARALKTIVPKAKPAIDQICDTLTRDFDFQQGGLAQDLATANESLFGAAAAAFQDAPAGSDASAIGVRSFSLPALQYAVEGRLRQDEILKRISSAATAIKKANAALADALATDRFTLEDVKSVAGEAAALRPAITELSKQAGELLDRVKILTPARLLP